MAFENFPWLDGVAEIVASLVPFIASWACLLWLILYGIVKFGVMRGDAYFRCKIFFPLIVLSCRLDQRLILDPQGHERTM